MAVSQLHIDLSHFAVSNVSSSAALAAWRHTRSLRTDGTIGFLDLPDDTVIAQRAMDFARGLSNEIDTVVVLGIGGSSLGPRAVHAALAPPFDVVRTRSPGMPRRLVFADNVDPATFSAILDVFPTARTLYCVITKSGGTAETAAQLSVVFERVKTQLGTDRLRDHLLAITDPERGALREVVHRYNLPSFAIPPNVGGRFSVLSPVGCVPAAAAGLDVVGLQQGAAHMRDRIIADEATAGAPLRNPALALAAFLHGHHTAFGRNIVVMMPYVDALLPMAEWFGQLWAESVGKERSTTGNVVNAGSTPVFARGATDQHSQLQLYAEGPDDKAYLFVDVAERGVEVRIPHTELSDLDSYSYLAGRSLGELLGAEMRGTIESLTRRQRPNGMITMQRLDAFALGEVLMLLEAATAFAGPLYGVDPFDQPGVEEAKRLAYAALGRPGYEDDEVAQTQSGSDGTYVWAP